MSFNRIENARAGRLQILAFILTALGLGLFGYFIYEAGIGELWNGVKRFGFGFVVIIALFGIKLATRVYAWTMCVEAPERIGFAAAFKAMVMGEALSTVIPLGIIMSGTAKAVAVRKQVPLVVGLSSIAIENLFFSFVTSILILGGGIAFLFLFHPAGSVAAINYSVIILISLFVVFCLVMIWREWRFASWLAEYLYGKGLATRVLHEGRAGVRRFEDLIYGFYRRNPRKFLPLTLLEIAFHGCGILEVWLILRAVSDAPPTFLTAFLLESVNRVILVVFKLIPFLLGVDEAGARFITETLAIGAGVGVTLAIIRKGRVLFWTALGIILVLRSGLSWREVTAQNIEE